MKINRNDPCHCGSGKKYKKCCMEKDRALELAQQAQSEGEEQNRLADYGSALKPVKREKRDYGFHNPKTP